jgi:hypothetical protein
MLRRPSPGLVLLLLAGAWAGCSSAPEDAPTVAPVTGKVTRKGAPLAKAKVTYNLVVKEGQPASSSMALTNDAGEYELVYSREANGATIGKHKVSITKDPAFDEDGKPLTTGEIVPDKYNTKTTLEVDVPPEGLEGGAANFDLDF